MGGFLMNLDLGAITDKLAIIIPYLSHILDTFMKLFKTMEGYLTIDQ